MATVIYFDHDVEYLDTPVGPAPALMVALANPVRPGRFISTLAYLDTGAQRTLFDGELAELLGIDILSGRKVLMAATHGSAIGTREHHIALSHPACGTLSLTVCFSEEQIHRNLLGRDFLGLLQIGFRHYDQMFFLSPRH